MRLYRRENYVIVVHYRLFEKFEELRVGKAILKYSLLRVHLAYNLGVELCLAEQRRKKVVVTRS